MSKLLFLLLPLIGYATPWVGPKNLHSSYIEPEKSWTEFVASSYQLENKKILVPRDLSLFTLDPQGTVLDRVDHNLGCSGIPNQKIHPSPDGNLLIVPCRVRASYLLLDKQGKFLGSYQMFKDKGAQYVKLDEAPVFLSDGRIVSISSFSHEARLYVVDPNRPGETDYVKLPGNIRDVTRPVIMGEDQILVVASNRLFILNGEREILKEVENRGFLINTHRTASIKANDKTALFAGFRNKAVVAVNVDGTFSTLLKIKDDTSFDIIVRFHKFANGNILVSASNGKLYLFSSQLTLLKTLELPGEVFLTDAVRYEEGALLVSSSGRAVILSSDLKVLEDHRLWINGRIEQSPSVLSDGTIVIVSKNEKLYHVDLKQDSRENNEPGKIQSRTYLAAPGGASSSMSKPIVLEDGSIAVMSGTRTLDILNPDATLRARYVTGQSNGIGSRLRATTKGVLVGSYKSVFHVSTEGKRLFDFKKSTGFIFGFLHQYSNENVGLIFETGWGKYTFEFYKPTGELFRSLVIPNGQDGEGERKLDRSMRTVVLNNGNVILKADPFGNTFVLGKNGEIEEKNLDWAKGTFLSRLSGERLGFLSKEGKLTVTDAAFNIVTVLNLDAGEFTEPLVVRDKKLITITKSEIRIYKKDGELLQKIRTPLVNISLPLFKDDGSIYVAGGENQPSGCCGNILKYSKDGQLEDNIALQTEWKYFKPVLLPLLHGELATTVTGSALHFFRKK